MALSDVPGLVISELASPAGALSPETVDCCLETLSMKHVNPDDPTSRILLKSKVFSGAMGDFAVGSSGFAVGGQSDVGTTIRGVIGSLDHGGLLDLELTATPQVALRRFVYVPILWRNCYSLLVLDRLLSEAYFVDCFMRFEVLGTIQVFVDGLADWCNCREQIRILPCGLDCGVQQVPREGVAGAANNCTVITADGGANFKSGISTCIFAERLFSLEIEATSGGRPRGSTSSSRSSAADNPRSLFSLMTQWTFTIPDFLMELENLMELMNGDEQDDYRTTRSKGMTCFPTIDYHENDDDYFGRTKSSDLSRTKNCSRLTSADSEAPQTVAGTVGREMIVERMVVFDSKNDFESSDHDSVSSGFETLNGEEDDHDPGGVDAGDHNSAQCDDSAQGSNPRSINNFGSEWLEGFKGSFANLKSHEKDVCDLTAEVPGVSGAAFSSKAGLPGFLCQNVDGIFEGKKKHTPPKTSRRDIGNESAKTPSFDLSTVSGTYFSSGLDIDVGNGLPEFLQLPEGNQYATSLREKPKRRRRTKVETQPTTSAQERQKSRGRQRYQELKETNPEKYEETLATSRNYYRRLKSTDPAAYECYKARYREHYQTLKQADPVAYEAYKARCRERYYKKRAAEGAEVVPKMKT